MKKIGKVINTLIIGSIITFSILGFNGKVYAENETGNASTATNTEVNTKTTNITKENTTSDASSTNSSEEKNSSVVPATTQKTTSNQSGTSSNNKTTNTSKKSSNANLSNLGITPNDFKGFKAQTTSYNVAVPTNVESVTIYANAQDSKAKIAGVGKQNLQIGENKFDVVVTAEDGTTKTYSLNITRDTSAQNTENVPEKYTGDGLTSLNIENLELDPKFDTQKYEYTVKYFGEKDKLDINAIATDSYYIVEITGNEKLVEGENIINILVSDPDGNNVATYQITVKKALVDEEAIAREKQEQTKKMIIIGGGIALAIIVIIVIIVIVKKRRSRDWKYDDYDKHDEKIENENNQLEDYDDNMNYIGEEELSKEDARKKFLENYDKNDKISNSFKDIEEEPKTKKHKGKRFK
ncbi:MAG: cadherin-like beta sandwich domain-containing protein [Clostridia bacterium]|nr:cadherin-like beta sandwich domain-containing protein [Clostridia bacterium]